MKRSAILSALLCLLLFVVIQSAFCFGIRTSENTSQDPASITYEELYDQLMNLKPDPAGVSVIRNLLLRRDVGTFNLKEGKLYLCKPIRGRVCAALFMGQGTFSFKPPTHIEQQQLSRFYDKDSLGEKFSTLFIIFADTTLEELKHQLVFAQGDIPSTAQQQIEYCMQYIGQSEGKIFNPEIMKTFLEDEHNDLFYAHFSEDKVKPMFFEINPYEFEEVRFMRRLYNDVRYTPEIVNQFHKRQEYLSGADFTEEDNSDVRIESYKLEHTVKDIGDISGNAIVNFHYLKNNQHWIYFLLGGKVDSVLWGNGKKAIYFHDEKNPFLWVQCDTPSVNGRNASLHTYGKHFYPVYGTLPKASLRKALFDLTVHFPSRFKLVSVGNNTYTTTSDGITTSQWVSAKPISVYGATFFYDICKELSVKKDSIPPITIFMSEHRYGVIEDVGKDVSSSITFFQKIFGKCIANRLYATEIGGYEGLAFPGLIYLASSTFRNPTREGAEEIFRAHEVAHQWWGLGVDFKTYHDQWISEGFADYSGLWYMQAALKDNDKFFNALEDWKKNIINNRKFIFGSGQEAGPIWLGYRTSSSSTRHDYDLIIYQKGAWVLHMLRNMLLDLETLNEDSFKNMMREFYQTYMGNAASTEDFRAITEKYTGFKMDWFFNQWVYGTSIPTYKFAYKTSEAPENKFKVECKVQQLNVPDDFLMFVPLLIDFGEKKFIRLQVIIKGPLSQFELPLLPMKPQKIIFNDLESVLCEVEYVDWK